ncbi:nucleotidyltransferase domain-containing protein [Candidatus Bathyarchaeota archaeon]|nr:nucleotidyltransferase domain-containing protein [Candidatus Bathyarchaeota archaeon]
MVGSSWDKPLVERAVERLVEELGDRVTAVALFGSRARGDSKEWSDFDFLIVVRGVSGVEGRFRIYDPLRRVLKRDVTVLDIDEAEIFREGLTVDSFLLNVAWDAVILYDPTGRLTRLFERVKAAVRGAGLIRYRTRDGKYGWRPTGGRLGVIEV